MALSLLGIGANLGDRPRQMAEARASLANHPRMHLLAASHDWPSHPVGGRSDQPTFLNAAALVETDLSPQDLLNGLQSIERSLGRRPAAKWDARSMDLDILLYGDLSLRTSNLEIPHPWMVARRFVLGPAADIAPTMVHPKTGWTLRRLWHHACHAHPRFALVGCHVAPLLKQIAERAGAQSIADVRVAANMREGSTVPDLRQSVELAALRAERLRRSGWDQDTSAPLLSEFWLGESLAGTSATDEVELRERIRRFERDELRSAPPKMVIVATGFLRSSGSEAGQVESRIDALRRELRRQDACPWIEVEATDGEDFVREVAGAIVAAESPMAPIDGSRT